MARAGSAKTATEAIQGGATLTLPSRLDLTTVDRISADILALVGRDLRLDAGAVDHVGGLGIQVLLAAVESWQSAGLRLTIAPRSSAFDAAVRQFGLSLDILQSGESI